MKKRSGLDIISVSAAWLAVLFPFFIVAGKGPSEIGVIVFATLFAIYSLLKKDFTFLKEKWVIAIGSLWFYLIIRSFFTPDIKHALAKSLPFIRFILFAVCLQFLVSKHPKTSSKIFVALCIATSFLVLDGFIQFFTGYDLFGRNRAGENIAGYVRLTGPFSKQILGTTIASLGIIMIAGLIPFLKKYNKHIITVFLSGILIYIIVFLSGERAALLRFITSIFLLWIGLFFKAKDVKTKKYFWVAAFAVFISIFVIIKGSMLVGLGNVDRQIASPIREVTNSASSSYLFLWKTGMNAGFSNILFGVGPNQFASFCQMHPHPTLLICTKFASTHPHNIWIELFAESGLVGITLFSIFLYALIKKFMKFYVVHNIFEVSLLLGIGLAAFQRLLPLPSSGFFKNWYAIPIWFAIGWMLCIISTQKPKST